MLLQAQKLKIESAGIECHGCTMDEIRTQEANWGINLPVVYREFLTICGKKSAHLFCGCLVELEEWDFMNERGRLDYEGVTGESCPESLFFIMEHHGYSYYYFDLNAGENPDIYVLVHAERNTHEILGKLDEVLDQEIDRLIKK